MKRSEMVEHIRGELHGLDDQPEVSRRLLTVLEELGMAPPEVAEPCKTSVMVATPMGWQEQVVEDSIVFVRKWEDEA